MTEQVRTISRTLVTGTLGHVTGQTLTDMRVWIRVFLDPFELHLAARSLIENGDLAVAGRVRRIALLERIARR